MNEADIKTKKQIVEKIKSSTNILIAVSNDPSVDELAATIGLAALLNKLDKHATAIFSGAIPPAISFLEPDKVFEGTVDSLRDFIIALDKEKADHLRYKLDGDLVKIFITPYRTTISSDDLQFSQGDYNVELVLALGVENQERLDSALAAHGQILHDATVVAISAGEQTSQIGNLEWHNSDASSLCEMIADMSELLKSDKSLMDKQIATSLLTGIVAATERFSNTRTTSQVMTVAANLMAAGADQQLIAARLQEAHEISSIPNKSADTSIEPMDESTQSSTFPEIDSADQSTLPPEGTLEISHEDTAESVSVPVEPTQPVEIDTGMSTLPPEGAPVMAQLPTPGADISQDLSLETSTLPPEPEILAPATDTFQMPAPQINDTSVQDVVTIGHEPVIEPLLGGTLNATTDQAAEEAKKALEDEQNRTILSHAYLGGQPSSSASSMSVNGSDASDNGAPVDIFASVQTPVSPQMPNLPPPPSMPDFSTLPPPPIPEYSMQTADFNQAPSTPTITVDPSQYRIPGQ
ncbi:hypothetical protein HGB24_00680 [Candidatus Saccharibacteria bacterium]|nr:hypothetical protein [Candidatus Saccharibacteria bacterium]